MKTTETLLHRYNESSYVIRLKARLLLHVCIALIACMVLIISYTMYLQMGNPSFGYSVDLRLMGFSTGLLVIIIVSTIVLLRGHLSLAAHTILTSLFITIWVVMSVDRSEVVSRLDTIVLVLAALSATPLFTTRSRLTVLLYSGANLAAFYSFMFYFRYDLNLSSSVFPAFLADNTLAFLFMGFISYKLFSINNQALEEMEHGKKKLSEANTELRAAMEELEATNEEFEAQNDELLRSEEELKSSEEELRSVFNGSHDAFIIHDDRGRILEVNDRMLEMYRLDREKALTLNIADLSSPEMDLKAGFHAWERTLAGENPVFEWKARHPLDGTSFDAEVGLRSLTRRGKKTILASVRDITFRKKAEEETVRSERQFRAIFENAPYGISINQLDNLAFVAVNPAFERNTGHRAEDVLGKNLIDIGMLGREEEQEKILKLMEKDGSIDGLKLRLTLKDGRTNTILLSSMFFDIEGVTYLLNFTVNITRLDLAEEALRQSEARFRLLIESLPLPIMLAKEGTILYVNRAFNDMAKIDPQQSLVGTGLIEFIAPEEQKRVAGFMKERTLGGQAPLFYESIGLRSDGSRFPYEISIAMVELDDSPATLAFIQDITERKLVEAALRDSEEKYRSLVENINEIVYAADAQGKFTYLSPAVERVSDYRAEELIGINTFSLVHPDDAALVKADSRALREGVIKPTEYRVRQKNGEYRWIISTSRPIFRNGTFAGSSGILADIHDRKLAELENKRMQAQLVQAQKMEAVGTLAGGIAHDFNNMLGGIMGSLNLVELLLEKDEPPVREILVNYIETAMESSRRAADMTKQLLTLSRKSELKLAPVDLNLSLKHVHKLCRNSFPKSVELDFRIGDAPLRIQADPVQIEQVLLNLCVNASHAMTVMRPQGERQGGALSVDAAAIACDREFCVLHPETRPGEVYVRIRVSDNGVGMSDKTRRQIFNPFFTTKKQQEGTGLGLAMAYGIVKQHGGLIDVYSEPGRGSTFNVYLPALGQDSREEPGVVPRGSIVPGFGTVLVVDDEKAILHVAKGILEQCGYRALTVQNGPEGIDIYRKEHAAIDAVLLDLSMPGISGLEVYARMKSINPGVKVLLTSGLMDDEEVKKALALGVKGFLQKPYSAEELSVKMKEVLE